MWNQFYKMYPHFLRKQLFSLKQKNWLHRYIENFPHFLRKQLFSQGQNLVTSLDRNEIFV